MRMKDAMNVINGNGTGYMVSFERKEGGMLYSDYFPDKTEGESLIMSESRAWSLAKQFASKTRGECVNIYVINADFSPVNGFQKQMIDNR